MRASLALLTFMGLGVSSCRVLDGGLPLDADGPFITRPVPDAALAETVPDDAEREGPANLRPEPPVEDRHPSGDDARGANGLPEEIGCSDGDREGFLDIANWPDIAGCSGAWRTPGLLGPQARTPQCNREAGNSSSNVTGIDCSVGDLCAAGWHVCRDAGEVVRHSRTGCESAVPDGLQRFFVTLAAATSQGVCLNDPAATNDLHGCGTFGQPETPACEPLDRRLGFADCQATSGSWECGTFQLHLMEARLVTKRDSQLGGALCCRD